MIFDFLHVKRSQEPGVMVPPSAFPQAGLLPPAVGAGSIAAGLSSGSQSGSQPVTYTSCPGTRVSQSYPGASLPAATIKLGT